MADKWAIIKICVNKTIYKYCFSFLPIWFYSLHIACNSLAAFLHNKVIVRVIYYKFLHNKVIVRVIYDKFLHNKVIVRVIYYKF